MTPSPSPSRRRADAVWEPAENVLVNVEGNGLHDIGTPDSASVVLNPAPADVWALGHFGAAGLALPAGQPGGAWLGGAGRVTENAISNHVQTETGEATVIDPGAAAAPASKPAGATTLSSAAAAQARRSAHA